MPTYSAETAIVTCPDLPTRSIPLLTRHANRPSLKYAALRRVASDYMAQVKADGLLQEEGRVALRVELPCGYVRTMHYQLEYIIQAIPEEGGA